MLKLRPYQLEAIEAIENALCKDWRTYVELPTGSGKTVTFLSYLRKNHNKSIILVPSIQLMNQVYESSLNFYHKSELSRKGGNYNESIKSVHICVVNSLRGDYLEFITQHKFDIIIIDEAHHSQSDSYKRFIKKMQSNGDIKILGVTATPDRSDRQLLKDILCNCCFKITIEKMINDGFLCDIEGFNVKTNIDISDVDSHNGDFSLNILYKKLCDTNRNDLILDIYLKHMRNRKTLIFCINIIHSKEITNLFKSKGISATHIDGLMKIDQRKSILDAFRNGEIEVLCNCQLLTEGFDEPSIDGIILARPTRSVALFTQMIGRGLRIFPGKKNCKIIDIVDNHKFLVGFNEIIEDTGRFQPISSFNALKDIKDHIEKEKLKVTEFSLERCDFFNKDQIQLEATDSIYEYLNKNKMEYFLPLSLKEGSFLIWMNELKKEWLKHGNN